jgi:transposase
MGRKSKELSPDKKEIIVKLKDYGFKISEISRTLGVPESTCGSILKTFRALGSFLKAKRMGRPKKSVPSWGNKVVAVGETGAFEFHAFAIFFRLPAFDFPAIGDLIFVNVIF